MYGINDTIILIRRQSLPMRINCFQAAIASITAIVIELSDS